MSVNRIPHTAHRVNPWVVLSWRDWQERLGCSYVTAKRRVQDMLDKGTLCRVPVCPRCGNVLLPSHLPANVKAEARKYNCPCGRRMGKGPSYAYAIPGEPAPKRVHAPRHRRGIKGLSELRHNHESVEDVSTQRERPLSRHLDLSRDAGIVYCLQRWGWHASQVLEAREDKERWALVCALT